MKKKLNINELRIQSFVTGLSAEEKRKLMGGSGEDASRQTHTVVVCTCITQCITTDCSAMSGTCC
jgi:hypothetical protein